MGIKLVMASTSNVGEMQKNTYNLNNSSLLHFPKFFERIQKESLIEKP